MPASGPIGQVAQALRFVWRSWRGITKRDLQLTLLLGFVVGATQGGGQLFANRAFANWRVFASPVMDAVIMALLLLLCLAVARNVVPTRVPKWVPYVAAAVAPILLDEFFVSFIKAQVFDLLLDEPAKWPGLTERLLVGKWLNVPPMVLMCFLASLGYMHARDARQRVEALRNVQMDGVRLGRQVYESRLQAMQARVEPQFLFETLGQIERLYESDPVVAERVLDDLIVYLRGVLPSLSDSDSIVATELGVASAWLDIMKVRTNGRLSFTIAAAPDARPARMPPMLLLPLIDHATQVVMKSLQPTESIEIDASVDGGRLRVALSDSGRAFADAVETGPIVEVRERLRALYGADAALTYERDPLGGTRAIIELPWERDP